MINIPNIESRIDIKDLDPDKIRHIEVIAEQASRVRNKRQEFIFDGFKYINRIDGDQSQFRHTYAKLFLAMVKEYDTNYKIRRVF